MKGGRSPWHHHAGGGAAAVGATGRAGRLAGRQTAAQAAPADQYRGGADGRSGPAAARARSRQARLFAMYGLTEAFRSTYPRSGVDRLSSDRSIGTAIPHAEVLVIADDGGVAADGEEGELVHCGPLVAARLLAAIPPRTAERFRAAPAGSRYGGIAVWSGDRVQARRRRAVVLSSGRRDAMIKSGGQPHIPAGGGRGRRSRPAWSPRRWRWGCRRCAVGPGGPPGRAAQLPRLRQDVAGFAAAGVVRSANCRTSCSRAAIHWREAMPLGANGKLDRTALYAELARGLASLTANAKPLGPDSRRLTPPVDGVLAIAGMPVTELVEQRRRYAAVRLFRGAGRGRKWRGIARGHAGAAGAALRGQGQPVSRHCSTLIAPGWSTVSTSPPRWRAGAALARAGCDGGADQLCRPWQARRANWRRRSPPG